MFSLFKSSKMGQNHSTISLKTIPITLPQPTPTTPQPPILIITTPPTSAHSKKLQKRLHNLEQKMIRLGIPFTSPPTLYMVTPTSTGITTTPLPVPSCHVKAERQRRRLVNRYTRKHERLAKRLRESLPPIPKLYVVPPETVEPVPPLPPPKSMGNRGEPVYAVPARVNVAGPSMASARAAEEALPVYTETIR